MSVTVKAYLKCGENANSEIRRFTVDHAVSSSYEYMAKKVIEVFPSLHKPEKLTLAWKDAENDMISFSSDEELMEALGSLQENVFRIYVTEKQKRNQVTPATAGEGEVLHLGVVCNGCDGSIHGPRFKCTVCPNYDLCKACEEKGIHPEHEFFKFCKPVNRGIPHGGFRGYPDVGTGFGRPGWRRMWWQQQQLGGPGRFGPQCRFQQQQQGEKCEEQQPGCQKQQDQGSFGVPNDFRGFGRPGWRRWWWQQQLGQGPWGPQGYFYPQQQQQQGEKCGDQQSDCQQQHSQGGFGGPNDFPGYGRPGWRRWWWQQQFGNPGQQGPQCHFQQQQQKKEEQQPGSQQEQDKGSGESRESAHDFMQQVGEQVAEMLDPLGIDVDIETSVGGMRRKYYGNGRGSHNGQGKGGKGSRKCSKVAQGEKDDDIGTNETAEKQKDGEEITTKAPEGMKTKNVTKSGSEDGEWTVVTGGNSDMPEGKDNQCEGPPQVAEVGSAVAQLQAMGFDNDNGWLTHLVKAKGGDINRALDSIRLNQQQH